MKKKYLLKLGFIVLLTVFTSCKKTIEFSTIDDDLERSAKELKDAKNAVIARGETFVIAINSGDSIGAANCYTNDAKIMRPNNKSIVGKSNILKAFSNRLHQGELRFSMKTNAIYGDKNALTAEEEWMLSDDTGSIIDEGKSLEIYKQENGEWKMFRDCFNSNLPCN